MDGRAEVLNAGLAPAPAAPGLGCDPVLDKARWVREWFWCGYRDRAGDDAYLLAQEQRVIFGGKDGVIGCESSWQTVTSGPHLGLAQFSPDTWAKARRAPDADWRDPYEQGWAVAAWIAAIRGREGTTSGWPHCWWVGGGP